MPKPFFATPAFCACAADFRRIGIEEVKKVRIIGKENMLLDQHLRNMLKIT